MIMLSSPPALGQVLYVRPTGNDSDLGSDWATAKQTVQAAIDAAPDGGTILIAAGTYLPTERIVSGDGRTATFLLGEQKNLRLIGGYSPDGSGVWNPRPLHDTSPSAYHTILSGELGASGDLSDNALHVVTFAGATTDSQLNGVIVRDGNANGQSYHNSRGAGVLLRRPFDLEGAATGELDGVVQNSHITANRGRWGAGIAVAGGQLLNEEGFETDPPTEGATFARGSIRTTLVDFNVIDWRGAGGINIDSAFTEVFGCVITKNAGPYHGVALQVRNPLKPTADGQRARIVNCTIALNVIDLEAGGGGDVAGIFIDDSSADPNDPGPDAILIESCILAKNDGGVSENEIGGLYAGTQLLTNTNSGISNAIIEMNYTLWAGYVEGTGGGGDALGVGNTPELNPRFMDAPPGSPSPPDLRLQRISPCINVGQPDPALLPIDLYDADGDGDTTEPLCDAQRLRRVRGCRVEMGAFEGTDACTFDLDGVDGIGSADLALLLGLFGSACACPLCTLDVDDDGIIGSAELAALLGDWGSCPQGILAGGEGGTEANAGQSSEWLDASVAPTPVEVAALLGFADVESLALWIAGLEPADRATIAMQLFGAVSGGAL
jgi:hypothetical protein